jgi:broad-specificity NMP kinase
MEFNIMPKTIFITGVNGVGKTTVIEPLKKLLDPSFEVHDFDERGVPDNVQRQWRLDETKFWIDLGKENSKKNINTVVCGFVKPSEVNNSSVSCILLDANSEIIKQRLWTRYQTPKSIKIIERVSGKSVQKFIDDNIYYSSVIREEAKDYGTKSINTSFLSPEQVAMEILKYLKSKET